jgi:hypothetical protein
MSRKAKGLSATRWMGEFSSAGRITVDPPQKPVHLASRVSPDGDVSAVCFPRPRAISLDTESWTIVPDKVTCETCKQLMQEGAQ